MPTMKEKIRFIFFVIKQCDGFNTFQLIDGRMHALNMRETSKTYTAEVINMADVGVEHK